MGYKHGPPEERFLRLVNKNGPIPEHAPALGPCWLWLGFHNEHSKGYGKFWAGPGRSSRAHIFSYETYIGSVPENQEIDHLCGVRHCVNPAHLEAVPHLENIRRGTNIGSVIAALKRAVTHCPKGHAYDKENTIVVHRKKGNVERQCRACHRAIDRRRNSLTTNERGL
jgi:hypothetical protein